MSRKNWELFIDCCGCEVTYMSRWTAFRLTFFVLMDVADVEYERKAGCCVIMGRLSAPLSVLSLKRNGNCHSGQIFALTGHWPQKEPSTACCQFAKLSQRARNFGGDSQAELRLLFCRVIITSCSGRFAERRDSARRHLTLRTSVATLWPSLYCLRLKPREWEYVPAPSTFNFESSGGFGSEVQYV